jgi:two-component system phosphate regulon sensor histidine kinase PhoR
MTTRASRTWLLVGLAFISIVGGTAVLGVLAMSASRRVGELTRQSMRESTVALADKIVRKVEKRIIDQDRALFDLVDLKDMDDFKVFWDRLTNMSSLVEGALVLDADYEILHYASKEKNPERRRFTELFSQRILPRLELENLAPGLHKHLHIRLGSRDYLISYLFMVQRGERFLVALKINMNYVRHKMLAEELAVLADGYVAAIVDQQGRLVHGQRLSADLASDRVRRRFPTTLYRWYVELAPRAAAPLAAHSERRDRISLVLMLGSLAGAVLGLGMLLWVVSKERSVSRMKGDFVTTVTHELKTPLSLIRMYAELMALDRPGAAARRTEYAAILTRETEKLSRLIDNVLDLSRLERGVPVTQLQRADLARLVEETVTQQRERLCGEEVTLATRLPEGEAPAVVDREAVRVALLNLLDNAVKYGAYRVEVTLRPESERWLLRVADDGPGIPAEERQQLFERFFRGRHARHSRERGSGIGLSLVRLVVEAHRGQVDVAERSGGGTVFEVRLPRGAAAQGGHYGAAREVGRMAQSATSPRTPPHGTPTDAKAGPAGDHESDEPTT